MFNLIITDDTPVILAMIPGGKNSARKSAGRISLPFPLHLPPQPVDSQELGLDSTMDGEPFTPR